MPGYNLRNYNAQANYNRGEVTTAVLSAEEEPGIESVEINPTGVGSQNPWVVAVMDGD